ncbi:MAG: heparinase II/III-family protein, partial [Anaerolineales bacterium]|nr:heparinase II/III-family protein [Anaerolineales bacterium]
MCIRDSHNTVTVDNRNPMTRAGRFLWLDWAKTKILVGSFDDGKNDLTVGGEHDGYRSLGVRVQRCVTLRDERLFIIRDRVESPKQKKWQSRRFIRLHWLVYPCEWQIFLEEKSWMLLLKVNSQEIRLRLRASPHFKLRIVEAGKVVFGESMAGETYGYLSPTYNLLQPALSIILEGDEFLPTTLETVWELPTI